MRGDLKPQLQAHTIEIEFVKTILGEDQHESSQGPCYNWSNTHGNFSECNSYMWERQNAHSTEPCRVYLCVVGHGLVQLPGQRSGSLLIMRQKVDARGANRQCIVVDTIQVHGIRMSNNVPVRDGESVGIDSAILHWVASLNQSLEVEVRDDMGVYVDSEWA